MRKLYQSLVVWALAFGMWAETKEVNDAPIPALPTEDLSAIPAPKEEASNEPKVVRYDEATNGTQPRYLNALDLSGYFRTSFSYFRDAHLGTYIPQRHWGTSNFMPNASLLKHDGTNPPQNNFSGNMRLRLDPTINVSEMIKVHSTINILNMVLGSTPSPGLSLMSYSQIPPIFGLNGQVNSIEVTRAWGQASFPIGELKFGRMPLNWGLGILYNSGDSIDSHYGDQADGIQFTTKIFDHYFSPSYNIAYSGPVARGGGFAQNTYYKPGELGPRYPLESGSLAHVFSLSLLKKDSDYMMNKKRQEGLSIFNYGFLGSYRHQYLDAQEQDSDPMNFDNRKVIKRDGDVGILSWWSSLSYKTFHLEAEFAGIFGKYHIGADGVDNLASANFSSRDVWLLQGGAALKSRIGFLEDRLQLGLDGGVASSGPGSGYGVREANAAGYKAPQGDNFKTNFKFNPAYNVDLLLFKEVLGGISGTYYVKPHLSYFFSRNFGLRADMIGSFAIDPENTTGNSNLLGVEADANAFLRTDGGFQFSLAYGVLFPLKGLDHQKSVIGASDYNLYGKAQTAQTLQFNFGILF